MISTVQAPSATSATRLTAHQLWTPGQPRQVRWLNAKVAMAVPGRNLKLRRARREVIVIDLAIADSGRCPGHRRPGGGPHILRLDSAPLRPWSGHQTSRRTTVTLPPKGLLVYSGCRVWSPATGRVLLPVPTSRRHSIEAPEPSRERRSGPLTVFKFGPARVAVYNIYI